MVHVARSVLNALLLALTTVVPGPTEARHEQSIRIQAPGRAVVQRPAPVGARSGAMAFVRTELYFGTARPDGIVTEAEFRAFVDQHVTPRFPDGLTLIKGDGQFRSEGSVVIKEQSFVLILLYPFDTRDECLRRSSTFVRFTSRSSTNSPSSASMTRTSSGCRSSGR
jgi:hypothetical protein